MNKRNILRGVLWAAVAATTLFIWSRSLYPVEASLGQSNAVQGFLATLFGDGITEMWWYVNIRKLAHFAEFALLGVEWGLIRHTLARATWLAYAAGPLTAIADELLQFATPGRGPQVTDVLIDVAGYATGLILTLIMIYWYQRRKKA